MILSIKLTNIWIKHASIKVTKLFTLTFYKFWFNKEDYDFKNNLE